jgi:hypothetical protein
MPDPLPKPPGRPPEEPIIIKNPPPPPEVPEIDGSLDEEDDPEIEKPPEVVPEMPPPPAPWDRADRLRLYRDRSGWPWPIGKAVRAGFCACATSPWSRTFVAPRIRRGAERLEQQQVLARPGRAFGRVNGRLFAARTSKSREEADGWVAVTQGLKLRVRFQRRGGRKRVVAPDGSESVPTTKPQPDGTLVKALARAWRWQHVR